MVVFRVEGQDYELKIRPSDSEIQGIRTRYVNLAKLQRDAHDSGDYSEFRKESSNFAHMKVMKPIMMKFFGWTQDELYAMDSVVVQKLYIVLTLYLATGEVREGA